ncbi:MAG: ion transporter [Methanothrix sp.]|nr:MAG: ion transporter [Methanothrix sp.]
MARMANSTKLRVYEILEATEANDWVAEKVNIILLVLVVLNVVAVVLETVDSIYEAHKLFFHYFSDISIILFTIEYILRIWSCDMDPHYRNPIAGRIKYALTPLALIDLLVILPLYITLAFPTDHTLLRSLRILWTFRLLKLHRYSDSLQTIMDVIKAQKNELAMSFTAIVFFLVLSSTVIFFLEHDAQPQYFPSIPATMWWAVLTMTTIGENIYPVTLAGKMVGGLIIILGVATFALPTSILTSGFVDELQKRREETEAIERENKDDGP